MSHFEVTVENGIGGTDRYQKGGQQHLGPEFGPQVIETFMENDGFVIIGFSGNARIRIPQHRVISILEG